MFSTRVPTSLMMRKEEEGESEHTMWGTKDFDN
jgi:hypothetical protein